MKVEIYKEYSKVFDFFNSGVFTSEPVSKFREILEKIIPQNASVTDVGGGTGLFISQFLKRRSDVKLTFIEPSSPMFQYAVNRLPEHVVFYNKTIEEVLTSLDKQDVFIFTRVLYALYDNMEEYEELFKKIYDRLNPGGYMCILEMSDTFKIDEIEERYKGQILAPEVKKEFNEKWPLYKEILEKFNKNINNGTYTIFNDKETDLLLKSTGFSKIILWDKVYIYRKEIASPERLRDYHVFLYGDNHYVLNIDKMEAFHINKGLYDVLNNRNFNIHDNPKLLKALSLMELINKGEENEYKFPDRYGVTNITLNVAQTCNLNCSYCYGSGGEYGQRGYMKRELAFQSVDWLIKESLDRKDIRVSFFGGEPLLNFPLIKEVVSYGTEETEKSGKNITFGLVTNGTILDEEIIEFLKEHSVSICVSFDALPELQNKYRPFKDGKESYTVVKENIRRLMEAGIEDLGVRTILADEHTDLKKVRKALFDTGCKYTEIHSASPVALQYKTDSHGELLEKIKEGEIKEYLEHLKECLADEAEELYSAIKERTPFYSKLYFKILRQLYFKNKSEYFCGAGKHSLSISISGDIYPCHRFNGIENMKMGHISDFSPSSQRIYIENHISLIKKCRECPVRFFCGGGCIYENIEIKGSMEDPHELWCEQLKKAVELAIVIYDRMNKEDKNYLKSLRVFEILIDISSSQVKLHL